MGFARYAGKGGGWGGLGGGPTLGGDFVRDVIEEIDNKKGGRNLRGKWGKICVGNKRGGGLIR